MSGLNRFYRVIWSSITHTWVAVSEITRSGGKQKSSVRKTRQTRSILAALAMTSSLSILAPPAAASTQLPTGGVVSAGQAVISASSNTMTVQQSTNRAAINWSGFDISANATVNFVQPDSSAVVLNRVNSNNPSQIYGNLNANGQIYLINPAGVYFAPNASVNVGGIVATTHEMSDTDFMAGGTTFNRSGAKGSVINEGNITSEIEGYIALLAPEVRNGGILVAQQGTVAMAGGESVTLNFGPLSKLESLTVTESQINTLVENRYAIRAPGGTVILSSQATHQLVGSIVNSGAIEANGMTQDGGRIMLTASGTITQSGSLSTNAATNSMGDAGTVTVIADLTNPNSVTTVSGTISARGGDQGGDGGQIETSANKMIVASNTSIDTTAPEGDTGDWTIDSSNFYIGTESTDSEPSDIPLGGISGAMLSTALDSNNVFIESSKGPADSNAGNIQVNEPVSWNHNTLSLTAAHSVIINAIMTVSDDAKLVINTSASNGLSDGISIGTVIVGLNTDGSFKGQVNFDRSGSGLLNIDGENYTVINSLGESDSLSGIDLQGMSGDLDGLFALGQNIDASATSSWNDGLGFTPVGALFTGIFNGLGHTVSNLFINRPTMIGTGLFASTSGLSAIANIGLSSGSVIGADSTGGLVGILGPGGISHSFNTGTVTGGADTGGLAGTSPAGTLSSSYATGDVMGLAGTGGLVGSLTAGSVNSSYSTGNVSGNAGTGGLVGVLLNGNVSSSFATGSVNGNGGAGVGGLVGVTEGNITNSYSMASIVSGGAGVGGLLGSTTIGNIAGSYANVGTVMGQAGTGGLVGSMTSGTVSDSYANTTLITGAAGTGGLTGSLTSGDISNAYSIAVTIIGAAGTGGFVGALTSADIYGSHATAVDITGAAGTSSFIGTASTGLIVNSYALVSGSIVSPDGVIPLSQSYTQEIAVTATNFSRTYDGTSYSGGNGVTYSAVMTIAPTGTLSYSGSSQGATNASATSYVLIPGGLTDDGNYVFTYFRGSLLITQAPLAVSGSSISANKTYDTTTMASISGGGLSGVFALDTETVSLNQSGSFATANAGTDITVTTVNTLTGSASDNYFIASQPTLTSLADITRAALNVTGTNTASDKVYDTTTTAAITGGALDGVFALDTETVSLIQSGSFATANAGTDITVTAVNTLTGSAADNYFIASQPTLTSLADITDLFSTPSIGANIPSSPAMTLTRIAAENYFVTQPTGSFNADIYEVLIPFIITEERIQASHAVMDMTTSINKPEDSAQAAIFELTSLRYYERFIYNSKILRLIQPVVIQPIRNRKLRNDQFDKAVNTKSVELQ